MEKLTDAARELRREMDRERYRRNPLSQRERNIRWLNRKAERLAAEKLTAEVAGTDALVADALTEMKGEQPDDRADSIEH